MPRPGPLAAVVCRWGAAAGRQTRTGFAGGGRDLVNCSIASRVPYLSSRTGFAGGGATVNLLTRYLHRIRRRRQGIKNSEETRLKLAAESRSAGPSRSPVLDKARPARPQHSPSHPAKRPPDARDPAADASRAKRAHHF